MATGDPTWLRLPPGLLQDAVADLPGVVARVSEAIITGVPAYDGIAAEHFDADLRSGIVSAVLRFAELTGTRQPALGPELRRVCAHLGRGEARDGRGLESILAAYRCGGRVLLADASAAMAERGLLDAASLVDLGDAVFGYVDELLRATADGYAAELAAGASERDRLRRVVADLLLRGRGDDRVTLDPAARAAGWRVPGMLRVVVAPGGVPEGLTAADPQVLVSESAGRSVALVPAESGRPCGTRSALARALGEPDADRTVVISPAVTPAEAARALRLAESALKTARTPHAWVEDAWSELVLGADPEALAELGRRRLAPLASLTPGRRSVLEATLHAWLLHWGQRSRVADALGVHPQTVAYRLAQLRDLLGDDLDEPRTRFELTLVLAGHLTP